MIARIIGTMIVLVDVAGGPAIPTAARKTIAATNAAWLEAMKRQDATTIAAIYGDEAVFITATGEAVHGRAAIEQLERERFGKTGRVVDGTIEDDGLARTGELVYEWGHVTLRFVATDGTSSVVNGRFLTVWAPDSKGRWRIIRNLSLQVDRGVNSGR
jgi:uncharacterized protein (TIGR02246 family)